jgi:hypothetical protein
MADESPPPSAASGQPERRRPAPTIDLKATEVGGSTERQESAATAERRFMAWLPAHLFWPMLGAVVAGAVLTLGLVLIVQWAAGGDTSAADARLAQLEQQVKGLASAPAAPSDKSAVDALASRLQKLETAGAAKPASDPAVAGRLSAAEGQLKTLAGQIATLGTRSDEATAAARDATQHADANASAIATLTQKLAQSAAAGTSGAQTADNVATLTARLDALDAGTKTLTDTLQRTVQEQSKVQQALADRAKAGGDDRMARAAAVAVALADAVERGRPFEGELAAAKAVAPDPGALAPLDAFATAGVPTPGALDRELSRLEPALMQAATPGARSSGILSKLQENAEKLIRIRPIDEAAGDDPATIIARLEVRSMRGDLAGSLAELEKPRPRARPRGASSPTRSRHSAGRETAGPGE